MSGTQRIGNACATNEWGEDRAWARSGATGKAELKEPGSQVRMMEKGQTVAQKLSAFWSWSEEVKDTGGEDLSCLNSRSGWIAEYSIAVGDKNEPQIVWKLNRDLSLR